VLTSTSMDESFGSDCRPIGQALTVEVGTPPGRAGDIQEGVYAPWRTKLSRNRWCSIIDAGRLSALATPLDTPRAFPVDSDDDDGEGYELPQGAATVPTVPSLESRDTALVEVLRVVGDATSEHIGTRNTSATTETCEPSSHRDHAQAFQSPSWSAAGSTGMLTVATLRGALGEVADDTPLASPAALTASFFNSPRPFYSSSTAIALAVKRIRHDGAQGGLPAERDAAFALRAIEFQCREAAARALTPEQVNLEFACERGIVLPTAVRRGTDATFVVMPFMSGGTLHDHLSVNGPMTCKSIKTVLLAIAEGLQVLHGSLLAIHRDLTPPNVLFTCTAAEELAAAQASPRRGLGRGPSLYRRTACLTDFGCAALLRPSCGSDEPVREGPICGSQTACVDDFAGSIISMSPERLAGESHGTSCDMWSLGMLALTMVLGRSPFAPSAEAISDGGALASPPSGHQELFWWLVDCFDIAHDHTAREAAVRRFVRTQLRSLTPPALAEATECHLIALVTACTAADPTGRPSAFELVDSPFFSCF
jgi:hypothetical protein